MIRNLVLLVSTVAILGALFVGYRLLVDDTVHDERDRGAAGSALPVGGTPSTDARVRVAGVAEVPSGKGVEFTIYDEHTGRPREQFQCDEWTPLEGERNEVRVLRPQLTLLLPSGMTATVSAAEGQITVGRIDRSPGQPKLGSLAGGVQIVFDRSTQPDRSPQSERPEDLMTVFVERLRFDLDLGELHSDGPLRIAGVDFELTGAGLDLVWNQADNLVESLVLREGEQLTLMGGFGLFRAGIENAPGPAAATTSAPSAAVAAAAASPDDTRPPASTQRAGKHRGATSGGGAGAYVCILTGGVTAEQMSGEDSVGRLTADEVSLLFDVGGAAARLAQPGAALGPASRPTGPSDERLVVRWSGPLRLEPQPGGAGNRHRRHFEALGQPVTLTHRDGAIRCGRLEYYDETQQVWLHPMADGRVDFALRDNLSATATEVYVDQAAHIVKLIGEVDMLSQRGRAAGSRQQSIHCALWAELRLSAAPTSQPTGDSASAVRTDLLRYGQVDAATFVGDAQVDLGGQTLAANRIDATFKPTDADRPLTAALDTAVATGGVRLARRNEALECERLELAFGLAGDGELFPRTMNAAGSVLIARERSMISGDQVQAELEPAPPGTPPDGPAFVLRTLDVVGDAELRDPHNKVAARGQEISATFTGLNRLSRGTVRGTAEQFGLVHASPYTVGGQVVELEWDSQTLHVDGPARLAFKAQRGLAGQRRERPTPVQVTCSQVLHVDGRRNTVHLGGDVVAASGEEQLKADTLTLLLEDVEKPTTRETPTPPWNDWLREARQLVIQDRATPPSGDVFEVQVEERDRLRKEPVRLVAENALVLSESYVPGDEQPQVHSSIAAPQFEVDIVRREITTRGATTLLVTSRRLAGSGADAGAGALGIPSGLITSGPSQTAMRCSRSMTYVLGAEGPARHDSALFEGDVVLVHRAGREMVNLEQMLPQAQTQPELISNLKSRNTTLQCDRLECGFLVAAEGRPGEPAPVAGRTAMKLTWLLASGSAELRDVQGDTIRSVNARQIDCDLTAGLVRVLGTSEVPARVYEENPATQDSRAIVGTEFTMDLRAGTLRSGPTRGEFREQ